MSIMTEGMFNRTAWSRNPALFFLGCLLLQVDVTAGQVGQFPAGEPVERVECLDTQGQSYSLYLPSSYSPERRYPVLFCFDPGYRGLLPVELFREAAERHGFILASSNNFRSDLPTIDESLVTLIAIWNDVHSRFSTDPGRTYATGFSGGARLSWIFDFVTPKFPFAGIIGIGAGLPSDRRNHYLREGLAFYGLSGEVDFNYYEMIDLDEEAGRSAMPHRFDSFQGGHEWASAKDCQRALDWMQLQAMRRKVVPVNESFLDEFFQTSREKARKAEADGRLVDAGREYEALIRDFEGARDLAPIREELERLMKSPAYREESREFLKQKKRALEYQDRGLAILEGVRQADRESLPEVRELLFDMRVSALQKRAHDANPVVRLAAQRVIESLFVQAVVYYPQGFQESGELDRARLYRKLACEIKPESPRGWYQLAQTEAQMGLEKSALNSLRKAQTLGFSRVDYLESDPLLEPLRENPEFQELIRSLKEN